MLLALLAAAVFRGEIKPASSAIISIGGVRSPIYGVSGGEPSADVVAKERAGKKGIASLRYLPVHFQADASSLPAIKGWISGVLARNPSVSDLTIETNGENISFSACLLTKIEFPSCAPGDSGLIDIEFLPEHSRAGKRSLDRIPMASPKPFVGVTVSVLGLKNPTISGLRSRIQVVQTVSENQIGSSRDFEHAPTTLEVGDLAIRQDPDRSGGLNDWAESFLIKGNSTDEQELSIRVEYLSGLTLNFDHCGIHRIHRYFGGGDASEAEIYAESVSLDGVGSSPPPVKKEPSASALPPTEDGKFGQAYFVTAAKDVVLTVVGATYQGSRFAYGTTPQNASEVLLTAGDKFVIVTGRVTNLGKEDVPVRYDTVHFDVFDDAEAKVSFPPGLFRISDHSDFGGVVLPGKSLDFQMWGIMPGATKALKLSAFLVETEAKTSYDLDKNALGALPAELSSPGDGGTFKLLAEIPATEGTWYPVGTFDARLDGISRSSGMVNGAAPDAGLENYVTMWKFRNPVYGERPLVYDTMMLVAYDIDGHRYETRAPMMESLKSVGDRTMLPASEATLAYAVQIPKGTKINRLTLTQGTGHSFVFVPKG